MDSRSPFNSCWSLDKISNAKKIGADQSSSAISHPDRTRLSPKKSQGPSRLRNKVKRLNNHTHKRQDNAQIRLCPSPPNQYQNTTLSQSLSSQHNPSTVVPFLPLLLPSY